MSMRKKIDWRCQKCGSNAIKFDATAVWNKAIQAFELDHIHECGEECLDCEHLEAEEFTYD